MTTTNKQQRKDALLAYIQAYYEKNGRPPTQRKMEEDTGLAIKTVNTYVKELRKDGKLIGYHAIPAVRRCPHCGGPL